MDDKPQPTTGSVSSYDWSHPVPARRYAERAVRALHARMKNPHVLTEVAPPLIDVRSEAMRRGAELMAAELDAKEGE